MKANFARVSRQITLKVERKFVCHPETVENLRNNRGDPRFRSLISLNRQSFNDTYYDWDDVLSSNGVWLRRRDGVWQAKIRRGGDYANSSFEELVGLDRIRFLLQQYKIPIRSGHENLGLARIAQFTTVRDRWKADAAFEIALDTTDFGHMVGEVELQSTRDLEGMDIRAITHGMDVEIKAFVRRYAWAFPAGKPVGKLSAYFARTR